MDRRKTRAFEIPRRLPKLACGFGICVICDFKRLSTAVSIQDCIAAPKSNSKKSIKSADQLSRYVWSECVCECVADSAVLS